MAKKRLNTPLLTILVVAIVLFLSGGAGAYWWVTHVDVPKLTAEGDAAFEAGDYDAALKAYSKIATKIKDDPELIIKIADTLAHTAARDLDTEDFRKSRGYYYTA
ncbi:MAG: hypothetical protein AAF743_17515, partial [Planctomycetota bacterium]